MTDNEKPDCKSQEPAKLPCPDPEGCKWFKMAIKPWDNWVGMPKDWIGQIYNACTEPCDMLYGACACGATHHLDEWIITRKKLTKDGWVLPESRAPDHIADSTEKVEPVSEFIQGVRFELVYREIAKENNLFDKDVFKLCNRLEAETKRADKAEAKNTEDKQTIAYHNEEIKQLQTEITKLKGD